MSGISRNSPCPCGSGIKFKRCCLRAIDAAGQIHAEDDRVGADMLAWAHATHGAALGELLSRSGVPRRLWFSDPVEQLRATWAMNDGVPDDGGPPIATRYVMRPDLPERHRHVARRIANARVGLYRVRGVMPKAWVEIEALDHSRARHRVISANVSNGLTTDSLVLARMMDVDGVATFWGPACRYGARDERKWLAFLRIHDVQTADGSLAALDFIPEDHAEPLPNGLGLLFTEWAIGDDDLVREILSDSSYAVDLGLEIAAGPDASAFAWLGRPQAGAVDLGGSPEDPERIEVARVIVYPNRLCALSAGRAVLGQVESWVEDNVESLTPTLFRAA